MITEQDTGLCEYLNQGRILIYILMRVAR